MACLGRQVSGTPREDQVPLISKFQKAHMEQASPCLEALSVQGFLTLPISWHPEVSRTAITLLKVLVIPGLRPAKAKLPDSGPFDFVHFWDQIFTMLQIAPSLPSHLQIPSRRQAQDPFSMYQACSKLLLHASPALWVWVWTGSHWLTIEDRPPQEAGEDR